MKPNVSNSQLLVFLIIISLSAVILLAIQNHNLSQILKSQKILKIGEKAYIFRSSDLNGNKVEFESAYALLVFFNTTCESCYDSAHLWQEFYEKHSSNGVKVVGVSADPLHKISDFVYNHELNFPIVADLNGRILKEYRVKYFPQIVLVNPEGRIRLYQRFGQNTDNLLIEAEKILKKIS